jgi:hypothetical protein
VENKAAVIIGSGPSVKKRGKYIDSFKYVIRFPYSVDWQDSTDYGTKTSFYCCTMKRSKKLKLPLKCGCFIWSKYGNVSACDKLSKKIGAKNMTKLVCLWQNRLPSGAYPFFSIGTAAICIAAAELKEPITVLGCDMLSIGEPDPKKYYGSWMHENRKQKKDHHSLDAERSLIDAMSAEYDVEIHFD